MAETGEPCDLAVIGAGPAGMAAGIAAVGLGLHTVVLDEQPELGGQIYRGIETVARERPADLEGLGKAYRWGARLVARFRSAGVDHRPGATVWDLENGRDVAYTRDGRAGLLAARFVLIATGAQERPVPIPGWTLPGVMAAGGLQSALKIAGIVPRGRVVLAGSGPLLLQVVAQYAAFGVRLEAVLDTTPAGAMVRALPHLPRALRAFGDLVEGARLTTRLQASATPIHRGVRGVSAEGAERVEAVRFVAKGTERRLACDLLALHEGVIPDVQPSRMIGAEQVFDETERCFRPRLDRWGRSSVETVYVAGDAGGIGGARAAELTGELAVTEIARRLGRIDQSERDRRAVPVRLRLERQLAIRPFLDAFYPPPAGLGELADDVVVCRCEEVSAGRIRRAVADGCAGPNQVKAFTRCGMGPCQGRMCGLAVSELIARELGRSPAEVGSHRIRSPLRPLPLGQLATLFRPRPDQ